MPPRSRSQKCGVGRGEKRPLSMPVSRNAPERESMHACDPQLSPDQPCTRNQHRHNCPVRNRDFEILPIHLQIETDNLLQHKRPAAGRKIPGHRPVRHPHVPVTRRRRPTLGRDACSQAARKRIHLQSHPPSRITIRNLLLFLTRFIRPKFPTSVFIRVYLRFHFVVVSSSFSSWTFVSSCLRVLVAALPRQVLRGSFTSLWGGEGAKQFRERDRPPGASI